MFRVMVMAVLAAGLLTFAVEAQAGIFFRRGGCPGGQCGGYTMPAASTTAAAAPTQREAAEQSNNEVAQQEPATTDSSTTTTATQSPIRRVGLRRQGGFRLFGRWR